MLKKLLPHDRGIIHAHEFPKGKSYWLIGYVDSEHDCFQYTCMSNGSPMTIVDGEIVVAYGPFDSFDEAQQYLRTSLDLYPV